MNGSGKPENTGWLQLVLIAVLFIGPIVLATWFYYGGAFRSAAGTNHGALLQPVVNLHDALASSGALDLSERRWLLVYVNEASCETDCREALYTLRQSRLMLGNDMGRLRRLFLHGDMPPDRVFVEQQHPGLVTLEDRELSRLLAASRPEHLAAGGYFLVDPLGNLVMYFPPDLAPGDMVGDIEHLLDLSRIG